VSDARHSSGDPLARRVARRLRPWLARLHKPEDVWQRGLDGEIDHWRRYLTTQGDEWPDEYRTRLDPQAPLDDDLTALIEVPAGGPVRILDVGAGPLTILGKVWDGHKVEVTAVDALAARYDELLAECAIDPPVRTRKCDTEHLDELFAPDAFDLVHARNTVDHGYDPARALQQMAGVTAPGGAIVLAHHRDVAALEAYEGLHQWNLRIDGGTYVAWRPGERRDLVAALGPGFGLERAEPRADGLELVVIRKSRPAH
jgi:SAM-dependent methyltransferase